MPRPSAEELAAANAPLLAPAIGAPTTGTVNPNRSVQPSEHPGHSLSTCLDLRVSRTDNSQFL
jgi:hypothetical protein